MLDSHPFFVAIPPVRLSNCTFYEATQHNLCAGFRAYWENYGGLAVFGKFLAYWQANGGLAIFGYPISEPYTENGRTVQYFERQRFELHPENAGTPYEVQLNLLGNTVLHGPTLTVVAQGLNNPRGVAVANDGTIYVAEAGAGGSGTCVPSEEGGQQCFGTSVAITTLATFPAQMVDAPPFLHQPAGTQMPAQSVPTSIALGPDGAYYVGELTGFPFSVGGARIWRVVPGQEPTVYASGFTNIDGPAFDANGNLLVLEIAKVVWRLARTAASTSRTSESCRAPDNSSASTTSAGSRSERERPHRLAGAFYCWFGVAR